MTDERRQSGRLVVPMKPPNNAAEPAAEGVEGSGLAKGNSPESPGDRTQGRVIALDGFVRQAARTDRKQRFTALLPHIYAVDRPPIAPHSVATSRRRRRPRRLASERWMPRADSTNRQSEGRESIFPRHDDVPVNAGGVRVYRAVGCWKKQKRHGKQGRADAIET